MTPSHKMYEMTSALPAAAAGAVALLWMRWRRHSQRSVIKIGSRDSPLAMYQANEVKRKLEEAHGADYRFEIVQMNTFGDRVLDKPLAVLAGVNPGLFTKELEVGLVSKHFDVAVHSLKDMPTALPAGLSLASITEREAPEDVLLVHPKHRGCGGLAKLPHGALVGTSSIRRHAIILKQFPHLRVQSIRGNLQTRLNKLDTSILNGAEGTSRTDGPSSKSIKVHYDAIVLAKAGVARLGWSTRIEATLDADTFPYGVGQGALGIECRDTDQLVQRLVCVDTVQHMPSALRCTAERAVMRGLQGGCQMAMGVVSSITPDGILDLCVLVMSEDGQTEVRTTQHRAVKTLQEATRLGLDIADDLRAKGAAAILGPPASIPRPLTYGNA